MDQFNRLDDFAFTKKGAGKQIPIIVFTSPESKLLAVNSCHMRKCQGDVVFSSPKNWLP